MKRSGINLTIWLCINDAKTEIGEIAKVLRFTNREDVSAWENITSMKKVGQPSCRLTGVQPLLWKNASATHEYQPSCGDAGGVNGLSQFKTKWQPKSDKQNPRQHLKMFLKCKAAQRGRKCTVPPCAVAGRYLRRTNRSQPTSRKWPVRWKLYPTGRFYEWAPIAGLRSCPNNLAGEPSTGINISKQVCKWREKQFR